MAPRIAYKDLCSICLASTFVFLVISLTHIHTEDENAAEKYAIYFKQLKPEKQNVTIANRDITKLKPEEQLKDWCLHVDTLDRMKMTSLRFSRIKNINLDEKGNITIIIETFDMRNKSKSIGDDIIVVWASQANGDGAVSGHVTDHKNGSYTGVIKVHWTGKTNVSVKLVSSLENICLRMKALSKYGNTVFATEKPWGIRGTFQTNQKSEFTTCGTSEMIFEYEKVCNFTSLNGGMSWFCGKPKRATVKCSDIKYFGTGSIYNSMVPHEEKIRNKGHGIFNQKLSLEIQTFNKAIRDVSCSQRPVLSSWTESEPSGYWLNNKWNFFNCFSNIKHDVPSYTKCLKNKNIVFIGDSTVRQYAEYFIENVLDLGKVNLRDVIGPNGQYHAKKFFTYYGINLMYFKHEMPFQHKDLPSNGIESVPQLLYSLENYNESKNSLILIINYNSHFSAYAPSKFRERIRHLTKAIERFIIKKPNTKIFFKGPHICIDDSRWFDAKISLLFEEIIREEFSKLRNNVIYLDVWSITVAHNSENLHPEGNAFYSQIHQLMSYIC